jgi:hypothetical protein
LNSKRGNLWLRKTKRTGLRPLNDYKGHFKKRTSFKGHIQTRVRVGGERKRERKREREIKREKERERKREKLSHQFSTN